jgi:hypothetical protein
VPRFVRFSRASLHELEAHVTRCRPSSALLQGSTRAGPAFVRAGSLPGIRLESSTFLTENKGSAYRRVFGNLTEIVADASGWAYAIVFFLALLDVFLPVVPSETAVVMPASWRARASSACR